MRNVLAPLGLALLVGVTGCADGGRFNLLRPNEAKINAPLPTTVPATEQLVAYLNQNSEKIPGILSDDVGLTCYSGGGIGIPVGGNLRAQGPRNFRLTAKAFGNTEVDLGSNEQEFWYWIKRGDPYQVFCSYQALEEGRVKQMPFPFQPDWVLEAMGMGKYGPADKYELVTEPGHFKLVERTKSPQGVPVKKIIVFDALNRQTQPDKPQVLEFLVQDERTGKEICSAKIKRRQILPGGHGEIPRELELRWPEQNMKLVLQLNGVQVNQQLPPRVFARTKLNGVQSFDLATGSVERIQPAGGIAPPPGTPR
jgi:hypothetical protein